MRLIVTLALLSSAGAIAKPPTPITITDGRRLGDVELNASAQALQKLGFVPNQSDLTSYTRALDGMTVGVDTATGRFTYVERPVRQGECVEIVTGKTKRPCSAPDVDLHALAERLGTCGPIDARHGGTLVPCAGVLLAETIAGLSVRLPTDDFPAPAKADACTAYPAPRRSLSKWPTAPNKNLCVGKLRFTNKTRLTDELIRSMGTCEVVAENGGHTLRCQALHLFFSGPDKSLAFVEYVKAN